MIVVLLAGMFVPFAAPSHADEADDQFAVAAGHYDRQQWKAGRRRVPDVSAEISQRSAGEPSRLSSSARPCCKLGKLDEARQQFHAYIEREPDGKYARPPCSDPAKRPILAGKLDAAKPDLEAFLAKYPGRPVERLRVALLGRHRALEKRRRRRRPGTSAMG